MNSFLEKELGELCRGQVRRDNKDLGVDSAYLPNAILCSVPKVCLVSLEPSMGNMTRMAFEQMVDAGFRNFLKYEGDLILHYCAYKFLCDDSFDYHITDISKGAMKVRVAEKERELRYSRWLPILQKEIEALGNPMLIAVGTKAETALRKWGMADVPRVRHFATQLDDWFRGYYLAYSRHAVTDFVASFRDDWARFISLIISLLPQGCSNVAALNRLRNSISDAGVGRFLYYRDEFLNLRKQLVSKART